MTSPKATTALRDMFFSDVIKKPIAREASHRRPSALSASVMGGRLVTAIGHAVSQGRLGTLTATADWLRQSAAAPANGWPPEAPSIFSKAYRPMPKG